MKTSLLNFIFVAIVIVVCSANIAKASSDEECQKNYSIRFESKIDHRYVYLAQVIHFKIYLNGEIYLASDNFKLLNTDLVFTDPNHTKHEVLVVLTYKNGAERILRWNLEEEKSNNDNPVALK